MIFQRDFLDIDLYSYAIWWEFSMKKKKKVKNRQNEPPVPSTQSFGKFQGNGWL